MERTDIYEIKPAGMDKYLSIYGWHFSKAAARFALGESKETIMLPAQMEKVSKNYPNIRNAKGYDAYFLIAKFALLYPDFNSAQVIALVDSFLAHSYDSAAFTHFYADCIANDIPIIWEDLL